MVFPLEISHRVLRVEIYRLKDHQLKHEIITPCRSVMN